MHEEALVLISVSACKGGRDMQLASEGSGAFLAAFLAVKLQRLKTKWAALVERQLRYLAYSARISDIAALTWQDQVVVSEGKLASTMTPLLARA